MINIDNTRHTIEKIQRKEKKRAREKKKKQKQKQKNRYKLTIWYRF